MKHLIAAAAAVALVAGTSAVSAQNANVGADVKVNGAAHSKAHASTHKRHYRATTGVGIETRDNNASAQGSLLPGKDRLNSKAFIADH